MFDFRFLNKADLQAFVQSDEYRTMPVVPISLHRAQSHIDNPRALANDILLVLAYQSGVLKGYLGLFADDAYLRNGTRYHFAWLSTLWLDDSMRGQGLGGAIVERGIAAWGGHCQVTEFVPAIKRMYDKTKAFDLKTIDIEGLRLYIRPNAAYILPPKKPIFKTLKPVLNALDTITNVLLAPRFWLKSTAISSLYYEYIHYIDDEAEQFIQSLQQAQLYKRKAREINWILQQPWIKTAPFADSTSTRYHFSAIDTEFGYYGLKIRDKAGVLTALLIFSKRNDILKLPFFYHKNIAISTIAELIDKHILAWKVNMFTVFHPALVDYYKNNPNLAFYQKSVTRNFLIAVNNYPTLVQDQYDIQDGDADCAFT